MYENTHSYLVIRIGKKPVSIDFGGARAHSLTDADGYCEMEDAHNRRKYASIQSNWNLKDFNNDAGAQARAWHGAYVAIAR